MNPRRPWHTLVWLAIFLPLLAHANELAEPELKAAFIYNFTKFTTWPDAGPHAAPLRLCSTGENQVSAQFTWLQGRTAQARRIEVQVPADHDLWPTCHLLYVTEPTHYKAVFSMVAQRPVLTVGEGAEFAQAGGIIGLQRIADRMRFTINLGAAQRAGLQLSSQLLQLAQEIIP